MVQVGNAESDAKPRFASLKKGQSIESITLEEALELFRLPRPLGGFESADVVVATGRFGPYIRHNSLFYSLPKEIDPLTVTLEQATGIILAKRKSDSQKVMAEFSDGDRQIRVMNGRFGAYLTCGGENYKIPKGTDTKHLTLEECRKIIAETSPSKARSKKKK